MHATPSLMRAAVLLACAGLCVHELRYVLAPPAADPAVGHGYLPVAGVAVTVALALAGAHLMASVGAALRRERDGLRTVPPRGALPEAGSRRLGLPATWLVSTLALIGVFAGQELLEGALSGTAALGPDAVFGGGGWISVPLAAVGGAVVALALAGARALVATALGRRRAAPRRRRESRLRLPSERRPSACVLASHLAGRPPPRAS